MSISHLDTLHAELPELFQPRELPEAWDDDFVVVRIDDPEWLGGERSRIDPLMKDSDLELEMQVEIDPQLFIDLENSDLRVNTDDMPTPAASPALLEIFGGTHPGALIARPEPNMMPPPDCLAFYLPFHYYHPTWWGVYLLYEGVLWLADELVRRSRGTIARPDAIRATRLFLYFHEAFHHKTECFATRLELTHRVPLYRIAFEQLYQRTVGTTQCLEEGLANAAALAQTNRRLRNPSIDSALQSYIKDSPPGYDQGQKIRRRFNGVRCRFAEDNQHACFPDKAKKNPAIWRSTPQMFNGISNIEGRVNYLIPRSSPLVTRLPFRPLLTARKLVKKLKELVDLEFAGNGGNHDLYRTGSGKLIPIPRHPGDLGRGLIRNILKQAGLEMSLEQFLRA